MVDSQINRADMWPWLATVYTVLGVVGLWALKAVRSGGWSPRCVRAATALRARAGCTARTGPTLIPGLTSG